MINYKKKFDDKLLDDSFTDGELLSFAREYLEQLQDTHILVCVVDRNIEVLMFQSYEQAYARMKYLFEEQEAVSVDSEISDYSAWVTDGSNHCDYDWKIISLGVEE